MPTEFARSTKLVARCADIASYAHRGQVRNPGGEAYVNHCHRVASTLFACHRDHAFSTSFNVPALVSAGYLHDVIEDCEISPDQLRALVHGGGTDTTHDEVERIIKLVLEVTHVSRPEDGNRAARRALDREHLAKSSREGATLKCADIIDNLTSPFDKEPWAKKYFAEKRAELNVLMHAYTPLLHAAWRAHDAGPNLVPKT